LSETESLQAKTVAILRKLLVAIAMAALFVLLGVFTSMGYRVHSISEVSFERHSMLGYADATFDCAMIFNPIVYPSYWAMNIGHISGRFSMIYVADAYSQHGDYSAPYWPPTPEGRYQTYILYLVTSNILPNLIFVFLLALTVEVIGKRELYIVVFAEMIAFAIGEIAGMVVGLTVGVALAWFIMSSPRARSLLRWARYDDNVPT